MVLSFARHNPLWYSFTIATAFFVFAFSVLGALFRLLTRLFLHCGAGTDTCLQLYIPIQFF